MENARQSGFTLLEVIVAMAIMALSLGAILSLQSNSINSVYTAKQLSVVARLAHNVMIETEAKVEGRRFEEIAEKNSGTFESPYQDYRYEVQIKKIEFPKIDFSKLANPASREDSDREGAPQGNQFVEQMGKVVTNFLGKALREIQVTVIWKRGDGEMKFSVSTWWVDLNHDFELNA